MCQSPSDQGRLATKGRYTRSGTSPGTGGPFGAPNAEPPPSGESAVTGAGPLPLAAPYDLGSRRGVCAHNPTLAPVSTAGSHIDNLLSIPRCKRLGRKGLPVDQRSGLVGAGTLNGDEHTNDDRRAPLRVLDERV